MYRTRGFTLIELMITVAVVGILAAIALPEYTNHVEKGRIASALELLSESKVRMEQIFNSNRSYYVDTAAKTCLDLSSVFAGSGFSVAVACDDTSFNIALTGVSGGPMSGFSYSIDQSGQKKSTTPESGGEKSCWLRSRRASC